MPLPFPGAKPMTLILSFHREEAEQYAATKRISPWYWIKDVEFLNGISPLEPIHVEYVGMHWRKRSDIKEIAAWIEGYRAAGLLR